MFRIISLSLAAMTMIGATLVGASQAGAITVSSERRTVTNEAALAMIAACKAYAVKNKWNISIAVVDSMGNLVAYERMDGASVIAQQASPLKAKTALRWRRPSKVIAERFTAGSEEAVWLGDFPVQGGLPIIVDGKAIGGIAGAGASSAQDEECALEGLKAVLGPNPAMQETR